MHGKTSEISPNEKCIRTSASNIYTLRNLIVAKLTCLSHRIKFYAIFVTVFISRLDNTKIVKSNQTWSVNLLCSLQYSLLF